MRILVTGAKGFVGKNLCAQLKNIRDGKARNYGVAVEEIFEYDLDSTPEQLDAWCRDCDFVSFLSFWEISSIFMFTSHILSCHRRHHL